MRRNGNWYNGSKRNKKRKDAKVHISDWYRVPVTQKTFDLMDQNNLNPNVVVFVDNAKLSKPNHAERFANINDCFPLGAIGHHNH